MHLWQDGVFEISANQHPEIHLNTHIRQAPFFVQHTKV